MLSLLNPFLISILFLATKTMPNALAKKRRRHETNAKISANVDWIRASKVVMEKPVIVPVLRAPMGRTAFVSEI